MDIRLTQLCLDMHIQIRRLYFMVGTEAFNNIYETSTSLNLRFNLI